MLERFYPGEYVDSTYQIDFERLYEEGYRGIIFDIDNTLVPHGAPADERACALFARLKQLGYSCMLLSNNKEPRVKMFNDAVGVFLYYKAGSRKLRLQKGDGAYGDGLHEYVVCGRSDFYRRVRCEPDRHPDNPGKTNSSQGRDSDRVKALFRKNRIIFLPAQTKKR